MFEEFVRAFFVGAAGLFIGMMLIFLVVAAVIVVIGLID